MLVDLRSKNLTGKAAERALNRAGMINTVIASPADESLLARVRREARELALTFPLYPIAEGALTENE
jgi:glycine/serine hydroxymethyltransferase